MARVKRVTKFKYVRVWGSPQKQLGPYVCHASHFVALKRPKTNFASRAKLFPLLMLTEEKSSHSTKPDNDLNLPGQRVKNY